MPNRTCRIAAFVCFVWACVVLLSRTNAAAISPADEAAPTLFPGRPAPALEVEGFLQGNALKTFAPGQIYIVEFWATWCGPCVQQFPHLSELQKKHAGKLTVIGVNMWEETEYSPKTKERVQAFITKQADRMSYTVAFDGAEAKTATAYMKAAGQSGIPTSFIIDGNGVVAWIGHPATMEAPLHEILSGDFNIEKSKQAFDASIELRRELRKQRAAAQPLLTKWSELWEQGKKDEALPVMLEMIQLFPRIGYDATYKAMSYLLVEKKDIPKARELATTLIETVYKDSSNGLGVVAEAIIDPENGEQPEMLDLAFRAADRANELSNAKHYSILDALATICFQRGERERAIDFQSKAIEAAGSDPEARAMLAAKLETYKKAPEKKAETGSKEITPPAK